MNFVIIPYLKANVNKVFESVLAPPSYYLCIFSWGWEVSSMLRVSTGHFDARYNIKRPYKFISLAPVRIWNISWRAARENKMCIFPNMVWFGLFNYVPLDTLNPERLKKNYQSFGNMWGQSMLDYLYNDYSNLGWPDILEFGLMALRY